MIICLMLVQRDAYQYTLLRQAKRGFDHSSPSWLEEKLHTDTAIVWSTFIYYD